MSYGTSMAVESEFWPRVYVWQKDGTREQVARMKSVRAALVARDWYVSQGYKALVEVRSKTERSSWTWKELRDLNAQILKDFDEDFKELAKGPK